MCERESVLVSQTVLWLVANITISHRQNDDVYCVILNEMLVLAGGQSLCYLSMEAELQPWS